MRTLLRFGPPLAVAATLLVAACTERTGLRDDPAGAAAVPQRPSLAIADATNGGRAGFYFLTPLVPTLPSYPGTFDPAVQATARICRIADACAAPLATFAVGGSPAITVDLARQAYVATWPAPGSLDLGTGNYRLEVRAAGTVLGFADLNVVAAPAPSVSGHVNVVRGSTMTIRFRIETGMVGAVAVSPPSASVTPGGTQVYTATVTDLHGSPIASPSVAWQSSNTGVATVSPAAGTSTTATGVADGSANIVATSNGVSGQGVLNVGSQTAPVAQADAYEANAGSSITVPVGTGVLANDSRGTPPGNVASFGGGSLGGAVTDRAAGSTATFGSGGSLTINADGSLSFTPPAGFSGSFTVQYRLTNPAGSSDATVTISVVRVPAAVNDSYTAPLSGSLSVAAPGVMANDDRGAPQGNVASFGGGSLGGSVTTNAAGATVADGHGGTVQLLADGSLTHTPAAGFSGTVTFTYRVTNTAGSSDATVTIAVPQAPSAVADAYTATLAGTLSVPASGVLANDALGSPAATITSFGGGSLGGTVTGNAVGATATFGTGGSLTVNADGSVAFTRSNGFTGTFTFLYRLTNAHGTSDATVTITVPKAPDAVNDAPAPGSAPGSAWHTAHNTTLAFPGGNTPTVLANDDRGIPQGDVVSFGEIVVGALPAMGTVTTNAAGATVALPDAGSLTVNADGSGSFTPPANFVGLVTFKYRLANAHGSDDATVTIAVGTRPSASNDDYTAAAGNLLGNVDIATSRSSQFSVLTNDQGSLVSVTLVGGSAQHGTAAVLPDGKFTFNPERGYEGPASFQYEISNGLGSAIATVSLNVSGMAWFIDDDAAASGNGTFLSKYNTLAAFQAANALGGGADPDNNDAIFLYSGAYTGPVTLRNGQELIGQGTTGGTAASHLGVTWPVDGPTQPSIGGAKPTITSSANDVNLASGNTVKGVALGNAAGMALNGSGFGTLTTADVEINTNGQAISLTNGTIDGDFPRVTSTGGVTNVALSSVGTNGTTDLGTSADALSGASGNALQISGGNGSFTYAGPISNTSGLAVSITDKSGGTVTLSGSINPSAAGRGILVSGNNTGTNTIAFSGAAKKITHAGATHGVSLDNNTGATISFTNGGLAVSTDDGDAFRATGGGTFTVQNGGAANTLASTGGIALNVQNTTIGSGGLTFQRIDANGGANGILLSNTGSTAGLTVTGNGGTCTNANTSGCSGGAIQSATGADGATAGNGIYLDATQSPSFTRMLLSGHANHAIRGSGVTGFTLANSVINGVNGSNINGPFFEGAVSFSNLTGSASITASHISGGVLENVRVFNSTGSLDRLTLNGVTIGHNGFLGGNGMTVEPSGNAVMKVTVQNGSFTGSRDAHFQYNASGSGTGDVVFSGNLVRNSHPNSLGGHLLVTGGGTGFTGTLTYNVANNDLQGAVVSAIVVSKPTGSGTLSGTISGNTVGNAALASSGSANGMGISVLVAQQGTHTTSILNNQLHQWRDAGIRLQAGGLSTGTRNATLNATVTGNTIANYNGTSAAAVSGIYLNAGTNSGDAYSVCVNLNNNTVPTTGFNGGSSYDMWSRFGIQTRLPGYTGALSSSANMKTYLTPRTTNPGANFTVFVLTGGGGGFVNTSPAGSACPTP